MSLPVSMLLLLCLICIQRSRQQPPPNPEPLADNGIYTPALEDDLDWTGANWQLVVRFLMQRQQLRFCIALARFDEQLVPGTACQALLANGPLMANCDIGNIEDLTMTLRYAFGEILLDTSRKCRPGLELFGVRCRRRA
ncbi:uncharacterized protein LOC6542972 [Drosophila erecta]|uniref:Uncharacterized protein n=1 Tax=Drosophila erecta TaxID=7220 RepID=B3N516_DROER|nr:uncharacterized protein LOC6542972 [Drosophila erecta]EDV58961.1 uncharacterized protein Dere_GG23683 [Drosophila erecta]